MKVKHGKETTKYGPGVMVTLTSNELASAIDLYLYSQDVLVSGPRTISLNGEICRDVECSVYVDPSGSVMVDGERLSGRGPNKPEEKAYEYDIPKRVHDLITHVADEADLHVACQAVMRLAGDVGQDPEAVAERISYADMLLTRSDWEKLNPKTSIQVSLGHDYNENPDGSFDYTNDRTSTITHD